MPRKSSILNYPVAMKDIEHKHRMRLCKIFFFLAYSVRGCVLWERHRDSKGYGQVKLGRQVYWAHRVYYALFNGPIPDGMTVHHKCGNPSCVNPEHLELATISENTAEGNRRRQRKDALPEVSDDIPF